MLPLHVLAMNRQRQVLRHHAIPINHFDTRLLQVLAKFPQRRIPIQLGPEREAPSPRKDGGHRIRARLFPLLMLAVVTRDGAVGRLGLDGLAVWRDEFAGHHAEGAEALRKHVGLDVAVVVFAGPDEAAGGFDSLSDHVVNEAVFIPYSRLFELGLVVPGRVECLQKRGVRDTYFSYTSWKMSLNLPSYFFKIVFFVLIYSGIPLDKAILKLEWAKPLMLSSVLYILSATPFPLKL